MKGARVGEVTGLGRLVVVADSSATNVIQGMFLVDTPARLAGGQRDSGAMRRPFPTLQ
jgi:hypothetical protein